MALRGLAGPVPSAPAGGARVPVDREARRRAAADLDRSWMLEAGAGTGKTSVLVARVLSILVSGRARLGEVAAITFTENAAADLKGRIRQGIEDLLAGVPHPCLGGAGEAAGSPPLAPEEEERLRAALEDVDQAPVSTIHAFAAGLLRERPAEAGLDPGFEVLDALDEALLLDEAWRRWLLAELDRGAPALQRAVALGVRLDAIRELAADLNAHADVLDGAGPPPPGAPASPPSGADGGAAAAAAGFVARFADGVRELVRLAEASCLNPADAGRLHIEELAGCARQLEGLPPAARERYLLENLKIAARGNQRNWRPAGDCARQKEICRALQDLLARTQGTIRDAAARDLLAWLGGFVTFFRAYKEERGALGFHDLLLRARDLLRDHPEVRGHFQRRYRFLLVDEFQDTDPLQAEIVFFLAEREPRAASWEEVEPAPGKLFIVGDPKQSIYRFRRADIEMYLDAREILGRSGCAVARLEQNFRSVPGVIDWVNAVFAPLIRPGGDGCRYQPEYARIHPFRDPLGSGPGVVLLDRGGRPADGGAGPERASDARRAEAACVAALIRRAVAEERWPVLPRGADAPRPARYGDVALLLPARTDVALYEEALRREGVPHRLDGGRTFYAREEVRALIQALAALADPGDAVAVLAVLRSPLAGCSDEDLVAWRAAGGSFNYLDGFPPGGPEAVAETFALLRELRPLCGSLPPARAVGEVIRRLRAREAALAAPHGGQALANLAKVVDLARAFEARGGTFRRLARWLRDRQVEGAEEEESLLHDPGDAVRILTIHGAKGLEYPVAILANLVAGGAGKPPRLIVNRRSRGLEIRAGGLETSGFAAAWEEERKREEAEHRRLFYVAATRARDHLVVSRLGDPGRGMLAYLAGVRGDVPFVSLDAEALTPFAGGTPPAADPPPPPGAPTSAPGAPTSAPAPGEDLPERLERWRRERDAVLARGGRGLPLATASGAARSRRAVPPPPIEAAPDPESPDPAEVSPRATDLGTAFHALMERADLAAPGPAAGVEVLEALADQVAGEFGVGDRRDELLSLARTALNAPVLRRARAAARLWREMPFCAWVAGRLVEGAVDLLFEEPDGLVVVDYKTDTATGEALRERLEHHRVQGAVYAAALGVVTGRPVKEVVLLYVRTGEEHAFSGGEAATRLAETALGVSPP